MFKSAQFGLVLIVTLPVFGQHHQPLVTFESPTVRRGDHGSWRWVTKTDTALPPDTIAPDHQIKPSDIAAWDEPDREINWRSPRFGREKAWFAVSGRVADVSAEEDLSELDRDYVQLTSHEPPHPHHRSSGHIAGRHRLLLLHLAPA
jgi:hypothetical protein